MSSPYTVDNLPETEGGWGGGGDGARVCNIIIMQFLRDWRNCFIPKHPRRSEKLNPCGHQERAWPKEAAICEEVSTGLAGRQAADTPLHAG